MKKSKTLNFLLILLFLLAGNDLAAQTIRVTGKVIALEDGLPIPGVTVLIVGTNQGSITNLDGEYSIDAKANDVLLFSMMGFVKQEIAVDNRRQININLKVDSKTLDEIVVIGYGTKKKSDIVGAVSTIKSDELTARPASNLQSLLTGKVSGMYVSVGTARPGGSSNITIRGLNSLMGSTDPLYVVDGIPVTSVNEINIEDIESISVLKDASSQAIYGARASNGVILVTTKRGEDTNGEVKVAYNGSLSIQNVKPNFELFSAEEYMQLRREAYRGDLANEFNNWEGDYLDDEAIFTILEMESMQNGLDVDWLDLAFDKNVPLTKHDFTFSGGTDKTKYAASLGYYDQEGVRYSSGYERYSGKLQIDQELSKNITLGLSLYYTDFVQDRENSSWRDFMVFSPLAKVYEDNGDLVMYPLGDGKYVNPLWWDQTRSLQNVGNRGIYNGYLEVKIPFIEGLKFRMNASYDIRNNENADFRSLSDPSNYLEKGFADVELTTTRNYLLENILTYETTIAEKHRVDVTLLQSTYNRDWLFTRSRATLLGNDFFGINSLNSAIESEVSRNQVQRAMLSYMGRINYIFNDRYLFNFTLRSDGSSVFGENNKWGYFPSVALAWNMDKESFMSSLAWIEESKIRLSWGQIGNEAISPYGSLATANQVFYVSNGIPIVGYSPGSTLPNPNLKWETTTTINFGYDFSFFKGRIGGGVDVYKRNTRDLLVNRSLPSGLGYSSMPDNLGEIENKGFEISLNAIPVSRNDFSIRLDANFSVNKNKLVEGVLQDSDGNYIDDPSNRWFIGQPIHVYYNYEFDGIWQIDDDIANSHMPFARPGDVRVKDVDGDGIITPDDRVIINREPSWIGSFGTSIKYKDLELSANVYAVQGVTRSSDFMSEYNYGGSLQGILNGISRDYFTPENPSNTTFRPHYATLSDYRSTLDYQDASYIRLSNVMLAYNLPSKWTDKIKVSNVRVYFRGDNLLTFTDYLSLGPETDPDDYPETMNYTFGININF